MKNTVIRDKTMQYLISIFMLLIVESATAQIPTGFDVIAESQVPLESGHPVKLVDTIKKCTFYGATRAQPKTGFLNELFKRNDYFVDVDKFVCGETVTTIKPISGWYEKPLSPGEKIRLPFISLVMNQTESIIADIFNGINVKCENGAVEYIWNEGSIPTMVPLWVDNKTINCKAGKYYLDGKEMTESEVKDFIIKDVSKNNTQENNKKANGAGIPTVDIAAVEARKSQTVINPMNIGCKITTSDGNLVGLDKLITAGAIVIPKGSFITDECFERKNTTEKHK